MKDQGQKNKRGEKKINSTWSLKYKEPQQCFSRGKKK